MGKRLTILPWSCHQTGDCCKAVSEVLMTTEEAAVIQSAVDSAVWKTLVWAPGPHKPFVKLQAFPCPLLSSEGKCSIYEVRPYNCRRWACMRPDPAVEPLEPNHGKYGCANVDDRITDRKVRKFLELKQRKAQKWARQHGWS